MNENVIIKDNVIKSDGPEKPGIVVRGMHGLTIRNCSLMLEDGTIVPIPDSPEPGQDVGGAA